MEEELLSNFWRYSKSIAQVVIIICLLWTLSYPLIVSGGEHPNESQPANCLDAPEKTVSDPEAAPIHATASQENKSNSQVNISFKPADDDDISLRISGPRYVNITEWSGFDKVDIGPSQLTWNSSERDHWVRYEVGGIETDYHGKSSFPHTGNWIIGPQLDYRGDDVYLEPNKEGYIGTRTIALGNFNTKSRTVGCQKITVIEPEDTHWTFDADARLNDLETAARSIPVDNQYKTVNVFVSSKRLESHTGFVVGHENDIIVDEDVQPENPSQVWVHEYVHTLQDYRPQPDLFWTYEGMANYLSYKITLENDLVTPAYYDTQLARGYQGNWSITLNKAQSDPVAYHRGSVVLAQIDSELKTSNIDIYDLFEWLNSKRNPGHEDLTEYLESEGGLSESSVKSFNESSFSNEPVEKRYQGITYSVIPENLWQIVLVLLSKTFRIVIFASICVISILTIATRVYERYYK